MAFIPLRPVNHHPQVLHDRPTDAPAMWPRGWSAGERIPRHEEGPSHVPSAVLTLRRHPAAYTCATAEDYVETDPSAVLCLAYATRMAPVAAGVGSALIDCLVDGHPVVIRVGWREAFEVGQVIADAGGIPVIVSVPRWAVTS